MFACSLCTHRFAGVSVIHSHIAGHKFQFREKFKCQQGNCPGSYGSVIAFVHHIRKFHQKDLVCPNANELETGDESLIPCPSPKSDGQYEHINEEMSEMSHQPTNNEGSQKETRFDKHAADLLLKLVGKKTVPYNYIEMSLNAYLQFMDNMFDQLRQIVASETTVSGPSVIVF